MKIERVTHGGYLTGKWEAGDCALVMAHVIRDSDGKTVSVQVGDHHIEDLSTHHTVAIGGFPHDNSDLRPITFKTLGAHNAE